MNKYVLIVPLASIFVSCSHFENLKTTTTIVWNDAYKSAEQNGGKMKGILIEPDSVKALKKQSYLENLRKKYPEYTSIEAFFNTKNKFVLEKDGELFRILDLKIIDDGSTIYNYDDNPSEVKYFYAAKDNFYVYTFVLKSSNLDSCTNIRRIGNGYFKEPVHDLIFENGRLVKENYVADVSKKFFEKDGIQYFEIEKNIDDSKVINLYNLGDVKKF